MRFIEYLIKSKYDSVSQFANKCDIPKCTMHHYVTGIRFPIVDNFMTIAQNLNVSAEYLYCNWFREVKENE